MSNKSGESRRAILAAGPVMAMAAGQAAAQPAAPAYDTPKLELALTAHVLIGPTRQIGAVPRGTARVIPITGGTFEGLGMKGKVMPGGADWQISRADGVTELHAHYGLECDDGTIIQVNNNCMIVPAPPAPAGGRPAPAPPIRSVLTLEAPAGPHDWLNKAVFVGTLNGPGDSQAPVVIRAFRVL